MKRVLISLVLIVLVIGLAVVGCAKPAPAPAPTPAPTPTPTPTPAPAPVKPIVMKLASSSPPTSPTSVWMMEEWAPRIEAATEGRVKIDFYWSETLGKSTDGWDYVRQGIYDITNIIPTFFPGKFPMTEVSDLPFVYPNLDPWKCLEMQYALWDKYFAGEWADVKLLWFYSSQPVDLITTNKPVRVMEDLKGMPLGIPGGPMGDAFQALGASPSWIPTPEAYMALDRGVIEAYALPIQAQHTFRLYESGKYETMIGIVSGQFSYVMHFDTWNRLSPADQKAFDDLSPLGEQKTNEIMNALTDQARKEFQEKGIEIIELTPEERARWTEATKHLVDDWATTMDERGLPGTELINEVRRLVAAK